MRHRKYLKTLKMIERNLQAQVIIVRTDRGTEFLNKTLQTYFKEEGIERQTSIARTPEQNGVVERRYRTLVEAAQTMLSASKLPLFFWTEGIATALNIEQLEDTVYLRLNFTRNHEDMKTNTSYLEESIRIEDQIAHNQSKEEFKNIMMEPTMEEYITITRINHESGNEKGKIELNGRFLTELGNNAFSGTNGEDTVEHVKKFLKIAYSLNVPNVSHDQLRVSIFLVSLTGATSEWLKDESIGSITKWVDLADNCFGKFYPPSHAGRKVETNKVNKMILWGPTDTKFENWLASKFMSYKTMDGCTKNALWNYWKKSDDQEVMTNEELSDSEDGNLNEKEKITQVFRIDTDIFHFDTPLCKAFEEFDYLLVIDDDVLTKDILGFKTYREYKDDWIYEWNGKIP
ncbi:zinc finger, CCHC-type containing protein [Tanacetum coccineum]